MTQEKANKIFATELGQYLNVIYVTSDDQPFIRHEEAVLHTNELLNADPENFVDTSITEWYPEVNNTVMKFIKKQLLRSINIVKHHWDYMVIESADDMELTWFGKWFLRTMMFGLFICYIPIVIVFMPLWLVIFK